MSLRMRPVRSPIGFIEPCLPSPAKTPPAGDGWLHHIKHDGYRMMIRRDGGGVRIITRGRYDLTSRYPFMAEGARQIRATSFIHGRRSRAVRRTWALRLLALAAGRG